MFTVCVLVYLGVDILMETMKRDIRDERDGAHENRRRTYFGSYGEPPCQCRIQKKHKHTRGVSKI